MFRQSGASKLLCSPETLSVKSAVSSSPPRCNTSLDRCASWSKQSVMHMTLSTDEASAIPANKGGGKQSPPTFSIWGLPATNAKVFNVDYCWADAGGPWGCDCHVRAVREGLCARHYRGIFGRCAYCGAVCDPRGEGLNGRCTACVGRSI